MSTQDQRFAFIVDWYDAQASLIRQYQFLFYPKDNSVEMYDMKNKKKFFSRSKIENISLKQLFLGNKINVCSRQLEIVDYGDEYTQNQLASTQEHTLALIKPDAIANAGAILANLEKVTELSVSDAKMIKLTKSQAAEFYKEHEGKPFYQGLISHMTSGPVIALSLVGSDAVNTWRNFIGPTNPADAKATKPNSVRAVFGTENPKNAAHGSDSFESARRETEFFFGKSRVLDTTATMGAKGGTCVIVKPHSVLSGQFGKILHHIQNSGWTVNALQLHNFERANAEEFYEVYKEVVPEYEGMVTELCDGPCIALEVWSNNPTDDISDVTNFKAKVAGARDPVIAKELDKGSLRALFGRDKVQNSVHCTDLPRDAVLELSYVFEILCE